MENFVLLTLDGGGFFDLFVLILVFILILVAAYYVTKWLSTSGLKMQKNQNIKILEVFRLNQSKYIYIVELGNKVVALGVSKDHIEYLTELKRDSLEFKKPESGLMNFKDFLKLSKTKVEKKSSTYDDEIRQFDKKEE